jgi:hypothetical protein
MSQNERTRMKHGDTPSDTGTGILASFQWHSGCQWQLWARQPRLSSHRGGRMPTRGHSRTGPAEGSRPSRDAASRPGLESRDTGRSGTHWLPEAAWQSLATAGVVCQACRDHSPARHHWQIIGCRRSRTSLMMLRSVLLLLTIVHGSLPGITAIRPHKKIEVLLFSIIFVLNLLYEWFAIICYYCAIVLIYFCSF